LAETMFVTGGAGFIGSNLAQRLLREGYRVRLFDNFSAGSRENLTGIMSQAELVCGDLRDREMVERAVDGIDVVFHQGALSSVPRSIQDPMETYSCNIHGTLNVITAARNAGVRRVVYASSSSIYGNAPDLPKREDMKPHPLSPYALSKLSAEQCCRIFSQIYGLETVSLRYFNVFGPRQNPYSEYAAVVPKFIAALLQGRSPVIFGDGLQSRDFTYIDNVVDANFRAAFADGASGEAINIACGRSVTLIELCHILMAITGRDDLQIQFAPERKADVKHSLADISEARQLLGYEPQIGLREGLEKTVAWYEARLSVYETV